MSFLIEAGIEGAEASTRLLAEEAIEAGTRELVEGSGSTLSEGLADVLGEDIAITVNAEGEIIAEMGESITTTLTKETYASAMQGFLGGDVLSSLKTLLGENFGKVITEGVETALKEISETFEANFKEMGEEIAKQFTDASEEVVKSAQEAIEDFAENNPAVSDAIDSSVAESLGEDITVESAQAMIDLAEEEPEAAAAAADAVEKNSTLKSIAESVKNGVTRFGKWVGVGIKDFVAENIGKLLIAAGIGALALYVFWLIRKHQHAMNGCWFVDKRGNKSKVTDLTCNNEDRKASSTGETSNCQILGCRSSGGGCNCDNDRSSGMCNTCCSCQSQNCDNGSYTCVKKNPAQAAVDLVAEVPEAAGGLIGDLLKILLKILMWAGIVILAIIGIAILFIILKAVFKKVTGNKSKSTPTKSTPTKSTPTKSDSPVGPPPTFGHSSFGSRKPSNSPVGPPPTFGHSSFGSRKPSKSAVKFRFSRRKNY